MQNQRQVSQEFSSPPTSYYFKHSRSHLLTFSLLTQRAKNPTCLLLYLVGTIFSLCLSKCHVLYPVTKTSSTADSLHQDLQHRRQPTPRPSALASAPFCAPLLSPRPSALACAPILPPRPSALACAPGPIAHMKLHDTHQDTSILYSALRQAGRYKVFATEAFRQLS